jgi:membrane-associated phospholipid phosphatase
MHVLIDNGIALIIALQHAVGDWFIAPMWFFSYLGSEDFFLMVLPLVYWSVDSALGLQVAFVLIASNYLNHIFKLVFLGPRPYWVSSHVQAIWKTEVSFGIPSNHAQTAVALWGTFAAYFKRTWVWVLSIVVMFLVGFSRIYLGPHFPHDVIVGWLLGAVSLCFFLCFWKPVETWLGKKILGQKILIAFIVSLILVAVGAGVTSLQRGFQIPETWISNSFLAGAATPDPFNQNNIITLAGMLFGLATGAAWIKSMGGYQASGPVWMRALRYVIGLIGILIFYMGLGAVFPRGDGFIYYLLRYIRYTLVGLWVGGGAPWLFMRFKIARRPDAI